MNGIRKLSYKEIEGMKNFNISILNNIIKNVNVGGGFFGGKSEYFLKFIDLYYKALNIVFLLGKIKIYLLMFLI